MRWVPFSLTDRAATGRDNAAARAAPDVDDDIDGGIARAPDQDGVLSELASLPYRSGTLPARHRRPRRPWVDVTFSRFLLPF